jgi:hypothetical protein
MVVRKTAVMFEAAELNENTNHTNAKLPEKHKLK